VALRARGDVAGFDHRTLKAGIVHAEPPFAVLARMLTTRLHLDPVDADNAPLLVSLGSHRPGGIAEGDIATAVTAGTTHACPARRGDLWVHATPILHAFTAAVRPRRHRVLQIDWSPDQLPGGLERAWVAPAGAIAA
jgi:hypothetical protein